MRKFFFSVLAAVLLAVGVVASSTGSVASSSTSRVNSWYLNGVNVPWYNWQCDFGCGPAGGGVSDPSANAPLATGFSQMQSTGMHVARWWTMEGGAWQINRDVNGVPTSLNPAVYQDFDAAMALAQQYDIYYDFVLFSGAATGDLPTAWLTDPVQRQALVNVLTPLFARYKGNPHLLSWELFNEPDFSIWNAGISATGVEDTARALTSAVHSAAPGTLVTVGTGFADGMFYFSGCQGACAPVGLDYYSPHWYDYMSGGTYCMICNNWQFYASMFQISQPIVVGETYSGTSGTTPTSAARLDYFYNNGYAGDWAWSLFPSRTNDHMAVDWAANQAFDAAHSDIGPRMGTSPTATPGANTPTPVPPTATSSPPPTATVPAGSGKLGVTTIGTSTDSCDNNSMTGSPVKTGASAVRVQSISVYFMGPADSAPFNQYQVAIYTDKSGAPNTLVSESASKTITPSAWNTAAITATLAPNTTYWLMTNNNGTSCSVNRLVYQASASGAFVDGIFGTWPSSFSGAATGGWLFSIYLTYGQGTLTSTPTPAPPTNTSTPTATPATYQCSQIISGTPMVLWTKVGGGSCP